MMFASVYIWIRSSHTTLLVISVMYYKSHDAHTKLILCATSARLGGSILDLTSELIGVQDSLASHFSNSMLAATSSFCGQTP